MSQYSEMMGSFIRTGNYPMEANYIFDTEESLKAFFEEPLNKTLLHKGLLKVVENAGANKQALYWVTKKETNDELEFTKLIEASSIPELTDQLESLQQKLDKEIQDRKDGDKSLWGTEDPTTIPGELNSIKDLADQVTQLWERCKIHEKMLDFIKAIAGTDSDEILEFLETLPYNSIKVISDTLSILLKDWDKTSSLMKLLDDLWNKIAGSPLPTDEFLTLRGIEQFVRTLKQQTTDRDNNLQTELDQTQIGVGLSSDGSYTADKETYYLQDATSVMNALKTLDQLVHQAVVNAILTPDNSQDVITLTVNKVDQGYIIDGKLDLSSQNGNQLIKKEDGLYYNVSTEYTDGNLIVKVNDQIISQHSLGFSAIVQSASYDPDQESIIIVFKLLSGELQTVAIPVGALIREWEVDNSHPDRVVELYHEDIIDGLDKLSGDVRISTKLHNILEKDGNTLYVGGNSDNIYIGDKTLTNTVTDLQNKDSELEQALNAEIQRATSAEQANATNIASNTAAIKIINGNEAQEGSIQKALKDAKDYADSILTDFDASNTQSLQELDDKIDAEIARAQAAEKVNSDAIAIINGNEATDGSIKKAVAQTLVSANKYSDQKLTEAKTYSDSNLEKAKEYADDAITTHNQDSTQKLNQLQSDLTAEINRATTKESELDTKISQNTEAIANEIERATQQENTINTSLQSHVTKYDNPHKVTKAQVGLDKVDNTTDLEKPISVATQAALDQKAPIDSPIFTGVAQVETSPDATDASQRIPSTNWVVERLNEKFNPTNTTLTSHLSNYSNPHKVTAEQVGTYTKTDIDNKLELVKLEIESSLQELITSQFENYWGTIQ